MQPFILSNSKLHDWENMCPIEFKAKHIDKTIVRDEPTEAMSWGNFFETLVIGGGIGGAFSFDSVPYGEKMKRSVVYERVKTQAERCKFYLKSHGGKVVSRQEYICEKLKHPFDDRSIMIEGTLDIRYQFPHSEVPGVIDLKLTGDTETTFGKFAWGSPEKMDLSQIIHYSLLSKLKYGEYPTDTFYWIFDSKEGLKKKLLKCNISEFAYEAHIMRLFAAYDEIDMCMQFDDWTPKNTFANCSKCKAKCNFERIIPEYEIIDL